MPRVSDPQPGNFYRLICMDNKEPHKSVVFKFVNLTRDGRYDIEIEGKRQVIGELCSLCGEFSCEIWDV